MNYKYNKWQIRNLLLSETIDFNNFSKQTLIDFLEQSRADTQEYKNRNEAAIKYIRSNEWTKDYEISSCRTRLLEKLEGIKNT